MYIYTHKYMQTHLHLHLHLYLHLHLHLSIYMYELCKRPFFLVAAPGEESLNTWNDVET